MTNVATGVVHKVPKDLREMLIGNPDVLTLWNNLTPLARNEWICFLVSVKQEETRRKHLMRIQEDLSKGKKRPCCWAGCPHRK